MGGPSVISRHKKANPAVGSLPDETYAPTRVTSSTDTWTIGDLSDPASKLGQSPLRSPSVFNFFRLGCVPPNSAIASRALNAPEFQITTESSVGGYVNFMQKKHRQRHRQLEGRQQRAAAAGGGFGGAAV